MKRALALAMILSTGAPTAVVLAQEPVTATRTSQTILLVGLVQPALFGGANLALTHLGRRVSVTWSHGMWLHLSRVPALLDATDRRAGFSVYSPWTTGLGVGLRAGSRSDIRLELKAHRYTVTGADGVAARYTTFSAGPGVYRRKALGTSGVLELSVRWWPNVASTLPGGRAPLTARDGTTAIHRPYAHGLIANISIGIVIP